MTTLWHDPKFDWLLRASWQAAVLIVLVLALQWLLGARLSPRWRYAMWLVVVLRLALPWTIPSRASVYNLLELWHQQTPAAQAVRPSEPQNSDSGQTAITPADTHAPVGRHFKLSALLSLWALGAASLAGFLTYNQYRISRKVTWRRPLIDARVMNLLEDCKQLMGVRVPVTLVETGDGGSPALFGFLRPRLLLPSGLTHTFSEEELRHVFLHELSHVKRRDIMVGWVMTALQILHWFNPLVWLAFHRMRVERELACDAMALSYARDSRPYGQTIIKLLEGFGCSAWGPSLAGTLEDRNQLNERIRMIANFTTTTRWSLPAIIIIVALGVVALTDAQTGGTATSSDTATVAPKIVSTMPAVGATEVDPGTSEIIVTFDQDMAKGFSWTGGGPEFPAGVKGRKAYWRDPRTCVLPVKLEAGHFYRVGINSTSYNNFRGTNGTATAPSAVYFTTQGAPDDLKAKTVTPQVIAFAPANGEQNVDENLTEVRVTFSVAMGEGCSWCRTGEDASDFPKGREGREVYWSDDKRTCVLPVTLESGKTYRLSINDAWHKNFQTEGGVPCEPIVYSFTTR